MENESNKYYTIDEVANILNLDESRIIFYFEKLNEFLNITSIGMYQLFDNTDIKNLKKIKDLDENQNMNIKEIRSFLKNNKQEVLLQRKEEKSIDVSVLKIFETFAKAMISQNNKIDILLDNNSLIINNLNNSLTTQKQVKESMSSIENKLQQQQQSNIKLTEQLEEMKKELALTKKLNDKLEKNIETKITEQTNKIQEVIINNDVIEEIKETKRLAKQSNDLALKMINKKEEIEKNKEQEEKQGFLSKIFTRKK
ncbi:MerR family transcriptional regulator [Clostridium sp. ZBS18]|uniref:MerR family transcriptional regulator n=1 Tax=Clostridium sp. ZBS18 TaxID=2949967 RepID=UPI00207A6415|nr:MerR family transcriptional regulator [Clostridium sp. ZBS18]